MKKVKGYLIGFGFIVLGVVIILFMFEHINKLYKKSGNPSIIVQ